ncbi:MAG: hypothetical protein J3Q66DRAFT_398851 [Benniella sp.]|nr:MAG: hypothetical protein J3Q66DRAFT_398851 [Benniella sp.]
MLDIESRGAWAKSEATLRTKLGSVTPKISILYTEEIDFSKTEGIEDILQQSSPIIRDADGPFSNEMESLLQGVTRSGLAEY